MKYPGASLFIMFISFKIASNAPSRTVPLLGGRAQRGANCAKFKSCSNKYQRPREFMLWHSISSSRFSPMQIVSKHSVLSKPVLRSFCLETIVYYPLPFLFLFTLTHSSARRAEYFSMYTSFSYGLLQKKGARAARKFFNI